jgi:Sigma-70, region 4
LPVGLSEDQKAMLRLLAQREQGYEDIAALMGISVEEVRERVKDALDQLKDEETSPAEPAPPPPPTPREPSPQAAPAPRQESSARAAKQQPTLPKISLPDSSGARAAIAAGVAALVVLVVVLIVGGGGGDGSDTTVSDSAPTGAEGEPTSANAKKLTKAVLSPVGGSEGTGVAIFGRVKNRLALQVEAEGLEPTANGHSYAIWLAQSPQKMLPLASTAVGNDGRIGTQFEVPAEVLVYLANETFDQIVITETEDATLRASLKKATSEKKAPSYTGTEVLRGTITGQIIGAAKRSNE